MTQTSWPRARKDQKVLGRPADLKLRGSLTTLLSNLMYHLHHLLPPVTDKPSRCRCCGLLEKLRHLAKCPVDLAESNPLSTCDVQCAQARESGREALTHGTCPLWWTQRGSLRLICTGAGYKHKSLLAKSQRPEDHCDPCIPTLLFAILGVCVFLACPQFLLQCQT